MRRHRYIILTMLAVSISLCHATPLFAAKPHDAEVPPPLAKLGRGFGNLFTGWMELPYNVGEHYNKRNPGGSLGVGLIHGTTMALGRMLSGAVEVVTFWMPFPPGYRSIMPEPDYYDSKL
jgi:putative exosortase-associated protein (TIGR04073 family)